MQAGLNGVKILWNSRENDRALATRLLAKNATLGVKIGRNELQIQPQSPLPTVPFRIVSITAEEKVGLTTEDFAGAEKLDTLESIDLTHTRLDDDVLEKFKGLTKLVYLLCGDTTMTGKPLVTFQTMPDVYTVGFGGSLANKSLVHFDKFSNNERG